MSVCSSYFKKTWPKYPYYAHKVNSLYYLMSSRVFNFPCLQKMSFIWCIKSEYKQGSYITFGWYVSEVSSMIVLPELSSTLCTFLHLIVYRDSPTPYHSCIGLHCVQAPDFIQPFSWWWIFGLFLLIKYYKQYILPVYFWYIFFDLEMLGQSLRI